VGVAAADVIRQMFRECNLLGEGKQPVGINSEDERAGGDASDHVGERAAVASDVVRVHCFHQRDVGVRVESPRELVAVKVEVGLDRESTA